MRLLPPKTERSFPVMEASLTNMCVCVFSIAYFFSQGASSLAMGRKSPMYNKGDLLQSLQHLRGLS